MARAMKQGYTRLVLEVPKEWKKQLHTLAIENDMHMRDYVVIAVNEKYDSDVNKIIHQSLSEQ